jgi:hypothetical protein
MKAVEGSVGLGTIRPPKYTLDPHDQDSCRDIPGAPTSTSSAPAKRDNRGSNKSGHLPFFGVPVAFLFATASGSGGAPSPTLARNLLIDFRRPGAQTSP